MAEAIEREEEGNAADDLSAAWDSLETEDSEHGTEEVQSAEASGVTSELPADDTSTDTPTDNIDPEGVPSDTTEEKVEVESTAAPVGLPAAAREEWAKTPKAMQEAIVKRERDYAVGIQRYAEGAKRAQQMDSVLHPYQQYFAMNGGNAGQQVQELLQTASVLQMGSPVQRAQAVAQIISQFGVDIDTLDRMIVGEAPDPQKQNQESVQRQIDEALAPYRQQEQTNQQQMYERQMALANQAGQEVTQFSNDATHEFYREVRGDMADILDLAANKGQPMTMQEAYRRACLLSTDVQNIIASRQKAELERKRKASSSVSGNLGGPGGSAMPQDMRGAIEMAWDAAEQQ